MIVDLSNLPRQFSSRSRMCLRKGREINFFPRFLAVILKLCSVYQPLTLCQVDLGENRKQVEVHPGMAHRVHRNTSLAFCIMWIVWSFLKFLLKKVKWKRMPSSIQGKYTHVVYFTLIYSLLRSPESTYFQIKLSLVASCRGLGCRTCTTPVNLVMVIWLFNSFLYTFSRFRNAKKSISDIMYLRTRI